MSKMEPNRIAVFASSDGARASLQGAIDALFPGGQIKTKYYTATIEPEYELVTDEKAATPSASSSGPEPRVAAEATSRAVAVSGDSHACSATISLVRTLLFGHFS